MTNSTELDLNCDIFRTIFPVTISHTLLIKSMFIYIILVFYILHDNITSLLNTPSSSFDYCIDSLFCERKLWVLYGSTIFIRLAKFNQDIFCPGGIKLNTMFG